MEDMQITAKMVTVGFSPSELRPRKMWTRLQEEFLELYNDYVEISNRIIPALNGAWETWHPDKKDEDSEKEELTPEEQENQDLKDDILSWKYACYMRDRFDQCAFEANEKHPNSYLSGFVFICEETKTPVFGARIKQHPELYMTFVINEKK